MATIAYVLLFLTLSSPIIHARESQFFAKVSNNPKETQPLNTNQNFSPQSQQEEGDAFGHESGQLPPSATNNNNNNNNYNNNNLPSYLPKNYNPVAYTTPIHSSTQDIIPNEFNEPQEYNTERTRLYNSQNQDELMGTNGGNNMYNSGKQGMSDTRFMDNGYNSPKQGFEDAKFMETEDGGNMYNSEKQGFEDAKFTETENSGNMYNSQKQEMGESRYGTSNNANTYNPERQGMSDTRFLENGKYYYDPNMENANINARFNSRNEDKTQGYYGNNENSYDRYNSNGGYQNQEEFQGDQYDP